MRMKIVSGKFKFDDDGDGKANRAFLDDNEDKKIDAIGYDYDQDGKWDKFEKVS